jgi:KDEL-tailed cysteine endopeptidase
MVSKSMMMPLVICLSMFQTGRSLSSEFIDFIRTHNRVYSTLEEVHYRQSVFFENLKYINTMNDDPSSGIRYTMNQFGDYTMDEFDMWMKGMDMLNTSRTRGCKSYVGGEQYAPVSTDVPDAWDWREHGAVTAVKNQGQCGSCWSFSATGAMEGAVAISTGQLVNLSEQQLMDCSKIYGDFGCNGGLMDSAFDYAIDNGMCLESDVPYTATDGTCDNSVTSCNKVAYFSYCMDVPQNNEEELKNAVFQTPVSVTIEADTRTFQFYSSGIIDSADCGTNLDHGVLAVGYGETSDGEKYWIVKNSWGETWGENGYVRIARSDDTNTNGICGIAMSASFIVFEN